MTTIDVDFEVFKELTARRRSEEMTENEVLREVLGLTKPALSSKALIAANTGGVAWVSKGVSFPHGTEFRATYKGQQFTAIVKNGALVMNGKRFTSPSSAAVSITGNPVNGWRFWECLPPGSTKWKLAADLR
ncbi:MAG: DUF2924 domain-containing protein [Rhodoferax sp.]|uniref:DUF2924 domain-containing protein n=1 Tax=Rhodoferax sp. TaxID=50421 RepID=UPI00260E4A02|nr:DUF2924 domain-containing protein [Rhodoferax sp.]MDD5335585.1 DUF2924 domain-containing protein [Rhodoferax sp.]